MVEFPQRKPKSKGVATLVDFIGKKRRQETSKNIYSVITALRGPDNTEERDVRQYKATTIALRSYVGMDRHSCPGYTLENWRDVDFKFPPQSKTGDGCGCSDCSPPTFRRAETYDEFTAKLRAQIRLIMEDRTGVSPDHPISHLRFAIDAIGEEELNRFAVEFGKVNGLR